MKTLLSLALFMSLAACTTIPIPGLPGSTPSQSTPLGEKICGTIPGTKNPAKYCHWKTCPVAKGTLWYQNGLLEDENAVDAPGSIFAPGHTEFKAMAKDHCLDIVSFSYGTSWMIRVPGTAALTPPSPTWAEVHNIVLPYIVKTEKLALPFHGYGQSMGGYNTASIALQDPSFFSDILLTHPVITNYPALPFALAQLLISSNFTPAEWLVANPMLAVKKASKMPRIYVAVCPQDEFGLFQGPKTFADSARAKGFDVTFYQYGSGCKHADAPPAAATAWMLK